MAVLPLFSFGSGLTVMDFQQVVEGHIFKIYFIHLFIYFVSRDTGCATN